MKSMKKMLQEAGAVALVYITVIFTAKQALAAASGGQSQAISLTDPLGGKESFSGIATAIAGFLFWDVAIPLCTIMVLVGAFQMITSAGNPEKVSKGRKTITYAAVGLIIALVAGGVTSLIQNFISGATSS